MRKHMAGTIKEIAEKAGVSRGTVDRALNNRGRVNPEVAERIFEIAREMNYQPKRKKKVYNQGKKIRIVKIFEKKLAKGLTIICFFVSLDYGTNVSLKKRNDKKESYHEFSNEYSEVFDP